MRRKSFLDKKEQNRSCKNKVSCKEAIVCEVNDRLPRKIQAVATILGYHGA